MSLSTVTLNDIRNAVNAGRVLAEINHAFGTYAGARHLAAIRLKVPGLQGAIVKKLPDDHHFNVLLNFDQMRFDDHVRFDAIYGEHELIITINPVKILRAMHLNGLSQWF